MSRHLSLRTGLSKGPDEVPAVLDEAEGPPKGHAFFLTHGAGGNLQTPGLASLAHALAAQGFPVVRFDLPYRAAGRKSPPKAEASVEGFAGAYADARRQLGNVSWVVGGRSYGGRVASLAVAGGLQAGGLLLYSYPLHRPGDPSAPRVDHWPQISVPVLFLEGTEDPFCDGATFDKHLPRLSGPSAVHRVAGGDHALKVSKKNSPDGRARSEQKVLAELALVVAGWADGIG